MITIGSGKSSNKSSPTAHNNNSSSSSSSSSSSCSSSNLAMDPIVLSNNIFCQSDISNRVDNILSMDTPFSIFSADPLTTEYDCSNANFNEYIFSGDGAVTRGYDVDAEFEVEWE